MIASWNEKTPEASTQICTLKYLHPGTQAEAAAGTVLLFAIKDRAGLRLYAHPALGQQISDRDRHYVEELVKDLVQRSKQDPEDVFRQLSSLSVGPLITDESGWVEGQSSLASTYPDFSLCTE